MGSPRALLPALVALLGGVATLPWLATWARRERADAPHETTPSGEAHASVNWAAPTVSGTTRVPPSAPPLARVRTASVVHGEVVDERGHPVAGAQLTLLSLSEVWDRTVLGDALVSAENLPAPALLADPEDVNALTHTAGDGTFALPVSSELVGVVVAATDGRTHTVSDVVRGSDREVDVGTIVLHRAGVASGIVTDEDGSPAAFTQISLVSGDGWATFETDADGRFRVEGLPYARWTFEGGMNWFFDPDPLPIVLDREVHAVVTRGGRLVVQRCGDPELEEDGRVVLVRDDELFTADDRELFDTDDGDDARTCVVEGFDGLRSGTYAAWVVTERYVGDLGDVAVHGSGETRFDAGPPVATQPTNSGEGHRLFATLYEAADLVPATCAPDVAAVVLHGRAFVARASGDAEEGDVLVAVDGHRVGVTAPETLPNWAQPCVDGAEAALVVARADGSVVTVRVPRVRR